MTAKLITTTFKDGAVQTSESECAGIPDNDKQELNIINLYPEMEYQTISHFGGAITEAVGITLSKMPPTQNDAVMKAYFGADGLNYRAIRTHIDSCDFSSGCYSAVSDPDDTELCSFSISHDEKYIISFIKMAYDLAGEKLPVMLSPWSPPAFMKTNASRVGGGGLKKDCYGLWARYICKYVKAYRSLGINVTSLTVQNEPNAAQTWDSCLFSPEEERVFLSEHLYPQLQSEGLKDVMIYAWDHNKERLFDRACQLITPENSHMISGFAFHWYSGDHFDALRLVREKFPDKQLAFSEGCIEYSRFDSNQLRNAQHYGHDILGNLKAGMNAFYDWNIALDENGGPNHVGNFCEAPIICNTKTGSVEHKLSYEYIGHFSRFILPGAQRIGSTNYSKDLEEVAFKNPDGSIAAVILNRTEKTLHAILRMDGTLYPLEIEKMSISTVVFG